MYFRKMVGQKCYLSPIDMDDAQQYVKWLNDEEVVRNLNLATKVISVESEKEILARLAKEQTYGIIDIETDKLIGNIGLIGINHVQQSAEIGIFIGDKKYWDRGFGTEALHLLIDFSFRTLNLHSIVLRTYDFNARAIACYEKVGFRKIGEAREALRYEMEWHNILFMDILPEDFYGESRRREAHEDQ